MIANEDMAKEHVIQVRCSGEERKAWTKVAAADDRTLSAWIRLQCNAAAQAAESNGKATKRGGR